METAWRSWLWNAVLTLVMLTFAVIFTLITPDQPNPVAATGFGIVSVVCWIGTVRAPMVGVYPKARGMVIRELARTRTIRWDEIESISGDAPVSGMAGGVGATAPAVIRRKPDGRQQTIPLNVIGGHGLSPVRPTPAERAITDLNEHLARWRSEQL